MTSSSGTEYTCGTCGGSVFVQYSASWPQQCPHCHTFGLLLHYESMTELSAPRAHGEPRDQGRPKSPTFDSERPE